MYREIPKKEYDSLKKELKQLKDFSERFKEKNGEIFFNDETPFVNKVEELFQTMRDLELSITYSPNKGLIIQDIDNTATIKEFQSIKEISKIPTHEYQSYDLRMEDVSY